MFELSRSRSVRFLLDRGPYELGCVTTRLRREPRPVYHDEYRSPEFERGRERVDVVGKSLLYTYTYVGHARSPWNARRIENRSSESASPTTRRYSRRTPVSTFAFPHRSRPTLLSNVSLFVINTRARTYTHSVRFRPLPRSIGSEAKYLRAYFVFNYRPSHASRASR